MGHRGIENPQDGIEAWQRLGFEQYLYSCPHSSEIQKSGSWWAAVFRYRATETLWQIRPFATGIRGPRWGKISLFPSDGHLGSLRISLSSPFCRLSVLIALRIEKSSFGIRRSRERRGFRRLLFRRWVNQRSCTKQLKEFPLVYVFFCQWTYR